MVDTRNLGGHLCPSSTKTSRNGHGHEGLGLVYLHLQLAYLHLELVYLYLELVYLYLDVFTFTYSLFTFTHSLFTWIFQQSEGSPVSYWLQSNPLQLHLTDGSWVQFYWNHLMTQMKLCDNVSS